MYTVSAGLSIIEGSPVERFHEHGYRSVFGRDLEGGAQHLEEPGEHPDRLIRYASLSDDTRSHVGDDPLDLDLAVVIQQPGLGRGKDL